MTHRTAPVRGPAPASKISVATVVASMTLLINLGALIWGAARITASVDQLARASDDLSAAVERIQVIQFDVVGRVRVLEDRDSHRR